MPNPYERASRLEKASALELFFRVGRVPIADIERMDDRQWDLAGRGARVKLPVGLETRKMVINSMKKERALCSK